MFQLNDKVKNLTPYEPISGTYEIRLDANESFLTVPKNIENEMVEALKNSALNRYPDPNATKLVKGFADYFNVDADCVTAGNGSDEILNFAFLSFCIIAPLSFAQNRHFPQSWHIRLPRILQLHNAILPAAILYSLPAFHLFYSPLLPEASGLSVCIVTSSYSFGLESPVSPGMTFRAILRYLSRKVLKLWRVRVSMTFLRYRYPLQCLCRQLRLR